MKFRDAALALIGSCFVYGTVAACSGADMPPRRAQGASGEAGAPGTGGSGSELADAAGDVWDALTDPVKDAQANQSGSRLTVRYLAGEDGSRQFLGWWDKQRQEPCVFQTAYDGQLRCMPSPTDGYVAFSDPTCTTAVLVYQGGACGAKLEYGSRTELTCEGPRVWIYQSQGGIPTPSSLYTFSGEACVPTSKPGNAKYYALVFLAPSTFALANIEHE